jgi:hypothetical protein
MSFYIQWITQNPILSAAIHFALLGTLGEILSCSIQKKRIALPLTPLQLLGKAFAWSFVGIVTIYSFTGMKGFTKALLDAGLLPAFFGKSFMWALIVSVFANMFVGPQVMFFCRAADSLLAREWNMKGIEKAWWTLVWFWTPAQTVTFLLPNEFQIGLAAIWSIALGLIMGFSKKAEAGTEGRQEE